MLLKPTVAAVLAGLLCGPAPAQGFDCIAPVPPFVPSDPRDVQTYADLLRRDFETYIADFEAYMRCLDTERARAFQEGQAVVREYGRFQEVMERPGPAEPARPSD